MIKVGRGWRGGYNSANPPFVALVGGDTWAFELSQGEWENLADLVNRLLDTIVGISTELADQEHFSFTIDSEWWELEAEGSPQLWHLRLQTRCGRRAEGFLPSFAVLELVAYLTSP